ncbi:unnamed protein product [Musa textilis]
MAESKPAMRKPEFTKVSQLRPGTSGHTLTVKVVSSKIVLQKGRPTGPQIRQMRLAQCLVGEENGMIIFTARNEQGRLFPFFFVFQKHNFLTYGSVDELRHTDGNCAHKMHVLQITIPVHETWLCCTNMCVHICCETY